MKISVRPATEVPWDDVRTVFGTRGDPSRCWCQWFKVTNAEWESTEPAQFERMLCDQVSAATVSPGLIAYADGEPAGWAAVEARPGYRRLTTMMVAAASPEPQGDPAVWAVTCFVVRVGYRKRGVSAALLAGAMEFARSHGARLLEGYPVDVAEKKTSSADLFHGALSTFLSAGFEVVARPSDGRAVVQLALQ